MNHSSHRELSNCITLLNFTKIFAESHVQFQQGSLFSFENFMVPVILDRFIFYHLDS